MGFTVRLPRVKWEIYHQTVAVLDPEDFHHGVVPWESLSCCVSCFWKPRNEVLQTGGRNRSMLHPDDYFGVGGYSVDPHCESIVDPEFRHLGSSDEEALCSACERS
jgi:hypothetical protein